MSTVVCPNCERKNRVPAAAEGIPKCGNCHRPLPWIADAGDGDFHEVAEKAAMPVLVDLWAAWCGPCRMVSPALDQLARQSGAAPAHVLRDWLDRALTEGGGRR